MTFVESGIPNASGIHTTETKCHLETEMPECEPEPKKPRNN